MSVSLKDWEHLFFEILERTLRLWNHVDRSCEHAARPNRRQTAQERIARTLTTRLSQNLEALARLYKDKGCDEQQRMVLLRCGLEDLAYLHIGPLSAVPRPYEPIELVSYIRQALKSYPDDSSRLTSPPHVFATEVLGDQAHSRFDLTENNNFKMTIGLTLDAQTQALGKLVTAELSPNAHSNGLASENTEDAIGFVSLPRIDLGNPLRWPSLMHEAGHFESMARPESTQKAFIDKLGESSWDQVSHAMSEYLSSFNINVESSKEEIGKWLMECWCDAHAARVSGAPALFSQMHAFLFGMPCYLTESPACAISKLGKPTGYPPAWFRLRLMRALITTRHSRQTPSDKLILSMVEQEWALLEKLFPPSTNASVNNNQQLHIIFNHFFRFLTELFPQDEWLSQSDINPENLNDLVKDLSDGLPIPTHQRFSGTRQTRTTHAEILLAGWAYRNNGFKSSLLETLGEDDFNVQTTGQRLKAMVDRADAALQMSIQVSEWFGILNKKPVQLIKTLEVTPQIKADMPPGLLPDHEIVQLVLDNKLRVIPLIDGTEEIVGTVMDVRLGHNFEIFFSNVSGSMDPFSTNRESVVDSMEVDYDSLQGLEIAPGQFVLGHTLEYLKLPDNIAAEVNGRSSFARLGIEIHMTAPFVEAGFDGCLTLEIANCGHSTVKLYPGMRIAQLRFYRCTSMPILPYGMRQSVKYRGRLRHNKTEQFSDWEIGAFKAEQDRRDKKNGT